MALVTNSLVDGEWVSRTLDVNTVLRHYDQQDRDAASTLKEVEKAPKLGLLTQTVIRSPLVHWILPAQLRASEKYDVAFIGVRLILFRLRVALSRTAWCSSLHCYLSFVAIQSMS